MVSVRLEQPRNHRVGIRRRRKNIPDDLVEQFKRDLPDGVCYDPSRLFFIGKKCKESLVTNVRLPVVFRIRSKHVNDMGTAQVEVERQQLAAMRFFETGVRSDDCES